MGTEQKMGILTPATSFCDLDLTHPARQLVVINTNQDVARILLSIYIEKFRCNAASAASGGEATSSSGGGSTSSSNGSHTHQIPLAGTHTHTINRQLVATSDYAGTPVHNHNYYYPSSTNDGDSGGVTSAESGGAHDHQVQAHDHLCPNHTHDIVFGIYEAPYFCGVNVRLQSPTAPILAMTGKIGDENNAGSVSMLDISSCYSKNGGENKLGPGVNWIYYTADVNGNVYNTNGLVRIYQDVRIIYK
ncbi:hypothetical protein [Methanocella paludicola]|nr:hypothetical protein [Methanocella paludicola]